MTFKLGASRLFAGLTLLTALLIQSSVHAQNISKEQNQNPLNYYGEELNSPVQQSGQDLIQVLHRILKMKHQRVANAPDKIGSDCAKGSSCVVHETIGYDRAKVFLLSHYNLISTANGLFVKDVYCEKEYAVPAPNILPDNKMVNVEHTWPQSRFTHSFRTDLQKADLHHLFPSDSEINSTRGNFPFGEVDRDKKILKCQNSRFGSSIKGGELVFQPPQDHRGNVARALFYFSVRYLISIDPKQEQFLRQWHKADPVDAEEAARNEEIFKAQGNRNPFIDIPDLESQISDF